MQQPNDRILREMRKMFFRLRSRGDGRVRVGLVYFDLGLEKLHFVPACDGCVGEAGAYLDFRTRKPIGDVQTIDSVRTIDVFALFQQASEFWPEAHFYWISCSCGRHSEVIFENVREFCAGVLPERAA